MMNSNPQNKLQKDRNQKLLLELASLPGNNVCADCKSRLPRWASHSLGIFICMNCASIHRKIGTHITKVKSLTLDDWTKDQIEFMKSMGNVRSNAIYNPNELRHPPPPNIEDTERDSEIEQYIRAKYEYRKFIDKSALVASKLGPSRSASSLPPRSVSSPLTNVSQKPTPSQPAPPSAPSRPLVTATDAAASTLTPRLASGSSNQSSEYPAPTSYYAQNQRSVSHPIPTTQQQKMQQQQQQNTLNGLSSIWEDLNSLGAPAQNSTLPLQYQSSTSFSNTQKPHVNGAIGTQGYPVGVTSAGMGMNPFQPQQIGTNPYSQQQSQSPFAPSQLSSSPFSQSNAGTSPGAQPYAQFQISSTPMMNQSTSATYMQPQPQATLQMQSPVGQSYMSTSPSQGFRTPSGISQPQFLSHSPSQPFLSPSPSQQFLSHSPQPQVQQQPQSQGQFGYQSPMSASSGQFGGMGGTDGQSQFLGMTTMQMQQQLLLQQQQQQQQMQQQQQLAQQAMFSGNQPQMYGQMFPQSGGYPTGGQQQWGAM